MPQISLDPNIVFLVFLPPLLHAAAWTLSWREFQRNFSSIAKLALGLVLFTILGLALSAGRLLPGFDWQSAVLLGAVVAATDAIAATSIARRVGLPQRIVEILEAESLVNDGTGLVALQFGLLILMTGRTPSIVETGGRLIFLIGGGVLIGLAVGAIVAWFEQWVDDGGTEIVISILVPYATYLLGAKSGRFRCDRGDRVQYVHEPHECHLHDPRSTTSSGSRVGRAHFHIERHRIHSHRAAIALCHGRNSRNEPFCLASIRHRVQPRHGCCSYGMDLWRDIYFLLAPTMEKETRHRRTPSPQQSLLSAGAECAECCRWLPQSPYLTLCQTEGCFPKEA